MNFPEKPSWDDALELWWAMLWRFALILIGVATPILFLAGVLLGVSNQVDLIPTVTRVFLVLFPFPAFLVAVRWATVGIWKSHQPTEGWQQVPADHLLEATPGPRPTAAPSSTSGAPQL